MDFFMAPQLSLRFIRLQVGLSAAAFPSASLAGGVARQALDDDQRARQEHVIDPWRSCSMKRGAVAQCGSDHDRAQARHSVEPVRPSR